MVNDPNRLSTDYGPCRMCGNSWEWHKSHFARHPYTPSNATNELRDTSHPDKPVKTDTDVPIVHTTTPFDPVLRLALIEKGIISTGDLTAAQEKLGVLMRLVDDKLGDQGDGAEPSSVDEDPRSGEE